jgi:N-acetylglucosamine-6-sulfatase
MGETDLNCEIRRSDGARVSTLSLIAAPTLAIGAVAVIAFGVGGFPGSPAPGGVAEAAPAQPRPNVVVIESDDQTQESMKVMDHVRTLLGGEGATFENSFVNFPLCCPSRATFLTGQYAHNHLVLDNDVETGGFETFEASFGTNNLAVWLKKAGYRTAMIGKYLNGYGEADPTLVPPGWSEFYAPVPPVQYVYNYVLNENATLVPYGSAVEAFKQDVLTRKAVDFVNRSAPSRRPFFAWLTYTAPHAGGPDPNPNPPVDCTNTAKPAPRHANEFNDATPPQPPSFNEADVSDKPPSIQALAPLSANNINAITTRYRCELESLRSVDEGVRDVVQALSNAGELGDTLVIYTSDNGFFHGEHRIRQGKNRHYEESSRVPLIMRGPGIEQGTVGDLAINADLAPTILDATDVSPKPGLVMDGQSLLPLAANPNPNPGPSGRDLLIETGPTVRDHYAAIRTNRYMYVEHYAAEDAGATELYDLQADPYEVQSLHDDPAHAEVKAELAERLADLRQCSGASCR